jgi:hypothetical protein
MGNVMGRTKKKSCKHELTRVITLDRGIGLYKMEYCLECGLILCDEAIHQESN